MIHTDASSSPIWENLNGRLVMHYDGQPDGYVGAKQAVKNVTLPNLGDAQVGFTPTDFGLAHWQEGQYWFLTSNPKGLWGERFFYEALPAVKLSRSDSPVTPSFFVYHRHPSFLSAIDSPRMRKKRGATVMF